MHNLGIAHLAYRILATTELDVLMKFAMKNKSDNELNGDYRETADDYEQVFHLVTHEKVNAPSIVLLMSSFVRIRENAIWAKKKSQNG
jgi:flagellar biosynthesis protein FliP